MEMINKTTFKYNGYGNLRFKYGSLNLDDKIKYQNPTHNFKSIKGITLMLKMKHNIYKFDGLFRSTLNFCR